MNESYRIERDSLGEVRVPKWAYWGAQTQRALENFPVSGWKIPLPLIYSITLIKRYAAEVNHQLGLLPAEASRAIIQASEEVLSGQWDAHFPLDVFQTGSGTSTNMNVNEVLANRSNELLGAPPGTYKPVHPNDTVNKGQSSNDVIPSAIRIALRQRLVELVLSLKHLATDLEGKSREFEGVLKLGRTHLMDAVPMSLGQEFSAFAQQVKNSAKRIEGTYFSLEELPLGGTAVGTGLNTHREFGGRVIHLIAQRTGIPFRQAENLFEALAAQDPLVEASGALNCLAVSLWKISYDLRLLASGPRAGLGEILLPALQPGSSIMPGKENPVIPEMMHQVCALIIGLHHSVSIGAFTGPLQLNMSLPLLGFSLLESTRILTSAVRLFSEKLVRGILANPEKCSSGIEWSLALVTPLAMRIGYDRAAQLAYQAYRENRTIREVARENLPDLAPEEIDRLLDPRNMLHPFG
ncbi:MAG: class II fumarate hydratase [bacterium JZ-2024 1]